MVFQKNNSFSSNGGIAKREKRLARTQRFGELNAKRTALKEKKTAVWVKINKEKVVKQSERTSRFKSYAKRMEIDPSQKPDLAKNELDQLIFSTIQQIHPVTRIMLLKLLNIPWSTLYDSLRRLKDQKVIYQYSDTTKTRGRPLVWFDLCKEELM